jgi:hypothetical protein
MAVEPMPDAPSTDASPEATRRLRPVPRQKLADLAYQAIRDSVVAGEYVMGERLVETKIAQELGMSRAPVGYARAGRRPGADTVPVEATGGGEAM